jgi:hypothetical protein
MNQFDVADRIASKLEDLRQLRNILCDIHGSFPGTSVDRRRIKAGEAIKDLDMLMLALTQLTHEISLRANDDTYER